MNTSTTVCLNFHRHETDETLLAVGLYVEESKSFHSPGCSYVEDVELRHQDGSAFPIMDLSRSELEYLKQELEIAGYDLVRENASDDPGHNDSEKDWRRND